MSEAYDPEVNSDSPIGDDTYYSEQQFSEEFDESTFNEPEQPYSVADTDGDGTGIGVDPNEYKSVEEEIKEQLLEEAIEDHQQAEYDRYRTDLSEIAESTAKDIAIEIAGELAEATPLTNFAGVQLSLADKEAERKEWEDKDDCYDLQEEILAEDIDYDRQQLTAKFEEAECNEQITPVVADFNELEECIDESATASEVRACLSEDYGDSDNDGIPTALDINMPDASVELVGNSEGNTEAGDELHADSYDIEGNDYFSNEPSSEESYLDTSYCDESNESVEPTAYEQDQLYTAEENAYMAHHSNDPMTATEYADQAEETLNELSNNLVSTGLEDYVQEAGDVADELDYSAERSNVVFDENTEEVYDAGDDFSSDSINGFSEENSYSGGFSDSGDSLDGFDGGDFDDGGSFDGGDCDGGGDSGGGDSD